MGANFDAVAPVYDTLATLVFGDRLQRMQVVWLNEIKPDASILLVGGGTGWLLEQVLLRCQPKRVVYIDASATMVSMASKRILKKAILGSVEYYVGDVASLPILPQFDVILTPFVLDLFSAETLRSTVIPQLQSRLIKNGKWIVTDFVETNNWWQKKLIWLMIRFFRLTATIEVRQLADWQQLLAESGLKRLKHQTRVSGMVSTDVWQSNE